MYEMKLQEDGVYENHFICCLYSHIHKVIAFTSLGGGGIKSNLLVAVY